ncbi:Uncharacterised protein [Legionella steigerwaltii]|uniref:Uncharacterized protein n=1 Tax=Legionella steigerwaltii TaxID=460 RepID=A0A378LBH8_9GAMM|nr:hypothetical protein [Legionella steigerwaltii]KTD78191.1 hypothetical protein Lstg_1472 [Legionella steigerwaltii]STY24385.1 Uncharacterised protein [Legionella steigerwaltii]
MFEKLNDYIAEKQQEIARLQTTLQQIEKKVFDAKEEFHELATGSEYVPGKFNSKSVPGKSYTDPDLIKRQIDYILLQTLYCEKLTPEIQALSSKKLKLEEQAREKLTPGIQLEIRASEKSIKELEAKQVKAWVQLDDSYKKLENMLIQARFTQKNINLPLQSKLNLT